MKNPLISVIIPIFNDENYIDKTLSSFLNQTYKNFEILCIDDLSTDNSVQIIKNYAKKDKRVRLIERTEKAYLPTPSIIFALDYAKGDYFFYLSQDDFVDLDFFEKSINRINETGADIVAGNMVLYFDDKKIEELSKITPPKNNYDTILTGREAFELIIFYKISGFALTSMNLVKKVGFDTMYFDSCDYATFLQFLHANKVAFVDTNFYYRQNNMNAVTKGFKPYMPEMILTGCRILDVIKNNKISKKIYTKYINHLLRIYHDLVNNYRNVYKNIDEKSNIKAIDNFKVAYLTLKKYISICSLNLLKLFYFNMKLLKLKRGKND